jgi:hypothetical protein
MRTRLAIWRFGAACGTFPGGQPPRYVYTEPQAGRSANLLDAGQMLYHLRREAQRLEAGARERWGGHR